MGEYIIRGMKFVFETDTSKVKAKTNEVVDAVKDAQKKIDATFPPDISPELNANNPASSAAPKQASSNETRDRQGKTIATPPQPPQEPNPHKNESGKAANANSTQEPKRQRKSEEKAARRLPPQAPSPHYPNHPTAKSQVDISNLVFSGFGAAASLGRGASILHGSSSGFGALAKSASQSIRESMLTAGKSVGEVFKSNIVTAGASAALTLSEQMARSMMEFQELAYEIGSRHFDMSEEEIRNAKWRGADEGQSKGTLSGAGIGAMIGGVIGTIFGPAGTAAGVAIGSAAGAWTGKVGGAIFGAKTEEEKAKLRQRDRWQNQGIERSRESEERTIRNEQRMSDFGYQELLARASGKSDRIGILTEKRDQIKEGFGENSIRSILRELGKMSMADKEGERGQTLYRRLRTQQSRLDDVNFSIMREKLNPVTRMMQPEGMADEYARKGLYVGAQVDVKSVNTEILNQLKVITDIIRRDLAEQRTEVGVFKSEPTLTF